MFLLGFILTKNYASKPPSQNATLDKTTASKWGTGLETSLLFRQYVFDTTLAFYESG